MVRQTRVRTASDFSNSFGPPQTSSSSSSSSSYLNHFGVGDKIPGFRTSAAFFTSLRANLHLTETTDPFLSLSPSTDMSSSAASTPPSLPTNPSSLPSLPPPSSASSSPLATTNSTTTTGPSPTTTTSTSIPTLTTHPTTHPATLLAALHLIADSVAQQRQSASRALIFHPLVLATFTALLAVVAQLLYGTRGDLALVATTWAGLVMAGLVGVRWAVGGYIEVAEGIGWRWLETGGKAEGGGEGEDVVVVSEWGEEVIGAMVVRFVREEQHLLGVGGGGGAVGAKGRRNRSGKGTSTAYIRAWTVKLRFRGKGVGTGLLEEAVRLCHERGADAVEFAADHASTPASFFLICAQCPRHVEQIADGWGAAIDSARVLPSIFNGGFERREVKARKMLEEVVRAQGGVGGRKR